MRDTRWLKKAIWMELHTAFGELITLDRNVLYALIDEVNDYERGYDDGWRMSCELRFDRTPVLVEVGDLVIPRGKHEASVYFVEAIDENSILLVDGKADVYFEGVQELNQFNQQYRLLAKSVDLIGEVGEE